jgi:Zn-dependent peptidase ImmA (M78 family)/transcriptional regulator with XRE-family HTH domain
MSKQIEGVEPSVLRWARATAGLSLEEVAKKLKRDATEIHEWERGSSAPTYAQLEKLAYEVYKRPLALFFFPAPPEENPDSVDFRTLPAQELESLNSDTRYHVRLAKSLQLSLMELHEGRNPSENPIFKVLKIELKSDVEQAASRIREELGISLSDQINFKDPEDALKKWRSAIEGSGVYIFKNSLDQKRVSGFSLQHEEFPIIYVNNSTAKNRQIFTLFHELCHILLGDNGILFDGKLEFGNYSTAQKRMEIFCNRVAAEVLFPKSEFKKTLQNNSKSLDLRIREAALTYKVSREVILRRFLDEKVIDEETYEAHIIKWANAPDPKNAGSGGNYYATNASYLGENYIKLVLSKHYIGQLSLGQVADYLGVKTKSVSGLESMVMKGMRG